MRPRSPLLVGASLLLASSVATAAHPAAGHWEGAFVRDGSVELVRLDIREKDGLLAGTFDIPELTLFGEPLGELRSAGSNLHFKTTYGAFDLVLHEDVSEMTGSNDWTPPARIHVRKRPRIFEYRTEAVTIPSDGATIAGTLYLPKGAGPHPAAVVVHGSATDDRSRWTYRSRGDLLARYGVAALVYDKRGHGASTGSENASFDDLAADAGAAARYLRSRREIDPRHVGLFGLSQGGWISLLASARDNDIAFLVFNSGPAVSVAEQERHRIEYEARRDGCTEAEIEAALDHIGTMFDAVEGRGDIEAFVESSSRARRARWASLVDFAADREKAAETIDAWKAESYDPTEDLRRTRIPVLALYGQEDVLVPPRENAPLLERLLRQAGNEQYLVKVFPHVGHNLELAGFLKGGAYAWPERYYVWPQRAPGYEETLVSWMRSTLPIQD
jgi:pimeloyl-ACP methyl ester carboxylesterase